MLQTIVPNTHLIIVNGHQQSTGRSSIDPPAPAWSNRTATRSVAGVRHLKAIKAYVLIVTDPGHTRQVYDTVRAIDGVVEAHEVMGPYDIVAELEVDNLTELPEIISDGIRRVAGVESTTSLVTFPE